MNKIKTNNLINYAFIDGNNLYLGAKSQGIKLDYRKLRLYLKNKFNVDEAVLFIGYDSLQAGLYRYLQQCGYILVYKPTVVYTDDGGRRQMKGNVDAELVLYAAAIDYDKYDKAVIVTSDGDFACLVNYLDENDKLERIITPNEYFSKLLKPFYKKIVQLKSIEDKVGMNSGRKSPKNRH